MVTAIFQFIARSGPAILILGGILGWILCGSTKIDVFCSNWVLILGVVLSLIWAGIFRRLPFG
jgi:hypothetical protein